MADYAEEEEEEEIEGKYATCKVLKNKIRTEMKYLLL
jgi:hypothetical protein